MKITFAMYEHNRVGFPEIKLKWGQDAHGRQIDPHVTIKGIIKPWNWQPPHPYIHQHAIAAELKRFEEWVVKTYADQPAYQG